LPNLQALFLSYWVLAAASRRKTIIILVYTLSSTKATATSLKLSPVLVCRPLYVITPGYIHNAIHRNTVLNTNGYSIKYNLAYRDSSVRVATHYGTEDRGIESRWLRGATHPSRQALGISQPPLHSIKSIFPHGKAVGLLYL